MKFIKKNLWLVSLFSTVLLAGCQIQPNQITFTTPSPTSSFNSLNQSATVNVVTQDLRSSAEVASYASGGNIQRLTAVPEVRQLFQQAVQQNLNSKGFSVVPQNPNANVQVNVRKFFADVEQGNLRHKITANIQVEILVQGAKGRFSKNFNTSRSYEGALGADNNGIRNVLNQAYSDIIQSIYNDNEVAQAIHQYK